MILIALFLIAYPYTKWSLFYTVRGRQTSSLFKRIQSNLFIRLVEVHRANKALNLLYTNVELMWWFLPLIASAVEEKLFCSKISQSLFLFTYQSPNNDLEYFTGRKLDVLGKARSLYLSKTFRRTTGMLLVNCQMNPEPYSNCDKEITVSDFWGNTNLCMFRPWFFIWCIFHSLPVLLTLCLY